MAFSEGMEKKSGGLQENLEGELFLESLVLIIGWGSMKRTINHIYRNFDLQFIENKIGDAIQLINNTNSIEEAWNILFENLRWSVVIISKYLHLACRANDFNINPPVPIDNKVIKERVWPEFRNMIRDSEPPQANTEYNPPPPRNWMNNKDPWEAYNRYMTAISCWAARRGWTTTQVECTLFSIYL